MFLCITAISLAPQGVHGDSNFAAGGLLAAGIIAVGKLGALLSAIYMHKYWTPPGEFPSAEEMKSMSADQIVELQTAPYR
jgi:hypothetical protein